MPDITIDGAFVDALKDVTYVLHIASPLPSPVSLFDIILYSSGSIGFLTDICQDADPETGIVRPAVQGTTSILKSAANVPSVRRVVITSSIVALIPHDQLSNGDITTVYTRESRVRPLPMGPYQSPVEGYRASKALALDAAEKFQREVKPGFSIVHVMPGYVFGANELVSDAASVSSGSNAIFMSMLGTEELDPTFGAVVHLDDVSRIHVGALDEEKVPAGANFITAIPVKFEHTLDIVKRLFPEAVEDGRLPFIGRQTMPLTIDIQATVDAFGPLKGYEEMVKSVVGQYLRLLANK